MPPLLRSFHYTFLSKSTPPTPEGDEPKKYIIAQLVTVWQAGHEIRTETAVYPEKPGGKVDDPLFSEGFVYAYNGLKYQWFSPGKETLVFSDRCRHPSPYYIACPLIYPYQWLGGQQVNWSDIKDPERWLKRFEGAKYVGEEKAASYRPKTIKIRVPSTTGSATQYREETLYSYVEEEKGEGLTFDVVSMPHQQMDADDFLTCEVKVYFARELGYYPLKWSVRGQKKEGTITMDFRVTDYRVFDVDEQKLIFPYATKLELLGKEKGKKKGEGMMQKFATEEGIRPLQVNIPLNEELFTISPSLAKTVTDFDAEIESGRVRPSTDVGDDGRPLKNTPPPVNEWSVGRVTFLVTSNIVLLLIIFFLLWRSRKK